MSTPTITVNGTFRDAAGDPMSGTLSFRLNHPLYDAVGNLVSERTEIVSTLNASGQITDTNGTTVGLVLYCTSGGDITPAGLLYDVKVDVGSRPHRVAVALPSSIGASVDWADLVPVPASTGVVWTVPDLTAEQARDLVGTTLVAGQGISVTVDDPGDTVTVAAEVTQAELDTAVTNAATDATTKANAKVSDTAYDATSWDGVTTVAPSKNAVRDKIESLSGTYVSVGAGRIDLNKAPYSAVVGQDITTALQTAINYIAANFPDGGEIYFSEPGTYLLNGAPQTGTAQGYAYNGQVLFPAVAWNSSSTKIVPIRIRGLVPMSLTSGTASAGRAAGVVIQSNATGAYMFDTVPFSAGFGWKWTGIMPIFQDICLRSPAGGTAGGVNALCALQAHFQGVNVDVVSGNGNLPTGTLMGIVGPHGQNSANVTYRDISVAGFYTGMRICEHHVLDNVTVFNCINAFEAGENAHTTYFQYVTIAGCQSIFYVPAGRGLNLLGTLDIENVVTDGAWNSPCYLVAPGSTGNLLNGFLNINLDGSPSGGLGLGAAAATLDLAPHTGPSKWPTSIGGGGGWRSKHPVDTFVRLANLTLAGYGPGQCWPTLHPWRLVQGTMTVASNQLKSTTSGGNARAGVPVLNGGVTRRVSITTTLAASGYSVSLWAGCVYNGANQGHGLEARITGGTVTLYVNAVSRASGGTITGSSTHTINMDVIHGAQGAPVRANVYDGTTLLFSYDLTGAETTALIPSDANYPYLEDQVNFGADTSSAVTAFAVSPLSLVAAAELTDLAEAIDDRMGTTLGADTGDLDWTYDDPTGAFSVIVKATRSADTAITQVATGLTGATTATRYVGGTANGPPTSGTFAVGDFVITQAGRVWVCITAGTPGTWKHQTQDNYAFPLLDSGEETMPRHLLTSNSVSIGASGHVRLCYFRARKTEACTQIKMISGGTPAGATPTLARGGFYSAAANGDLTLEAACANDTALFATLNTEYTRSLTSTFNKVAGQVYAYGVLVVTAAALPTMMGNAGIQGTAATRAAKPRIAAVRTGQTDLPASITDASLADSNLVYYAEALP